MTTPATHAGLTPEEEAIARAASYLADEPDAAARASVERWLQAAASGDAAARHEVVERFGRTLEFGTAGLRGPMGPGTAWMNRVMVSRAAWGLGRMLQEQGLGRAAAAGVVIGFDGRHHSRAYAEDAASVLAGLGIPVWIFDQVVPTPLCAFAVRQLGAAAGAMVTASHNPPEDNGFKVYQASGGQIIPPQDGAIAAWIERAPPLAEMARPSPFAAARAGLRRGAPAAVEEAWHDAMAATSLHPGVASQAALPIVYTAMHGVGARHVLAALRRAGFEGVATVAAQTEPDGAFPTVAFPNPEEKGALDLAFARADEVGAALVLANDPDADRLAVAVPGRAGGWRVLSGNEIGWLLGADALERFDAGDRRKLVVTSIVSSALLARMAAAHGAESAEVLTGFKWIADAAERAEASGAVRFVFGYEEAIGYEVGGLVRDKDGVHAAVRMAELAAHLASQGQSVLDRLDALALRFGLPVGDQWSARLPGSDGLAQIAALMARLRAHPLTELAGLPLALRRDLRHDGVWSADGRARGLGLPAADVLIYVDADGTRLIVRPSGTEPKIKFYLEAFQAVTSADELDAARQAGRERLAIIRAWLNQQLGLS